MARLTGWMGKTICVVVLLVIGSPINAELLTFEDVPGGSVQNSFGAMPTYKGYDFSMTFVWVDVVNSPNPWGSHSGDFGIVNNQGGVGTITRPDSGDFRFEGIWAKQWFTLPESGGPDAIFGTLEGWNDGELVWSVDTGLNGSYKFFGSQSGDIDELRLGFGGNFLADDLSLVSPGDVDLNGFVDLLDVAPFIDLLATGGFQAEADINEDGAVNLLDVQPFVQLLSGG